MYTLGLLEQIKSSIVSTGHAGIVPPIIDMITYSEHQLETRTPLHRFAQCCLPIITKLISPKINFGQLAMDAKHVSDMLRAS